MLAYAWDGRPIPQDHGFPLRIWLPDRYGMKQPKWITEIEVIGDYKKGYWVEGGWDEVAAVKTTSVVDTIAIDSVVEENRTEACSHRRNSSLRRQAHIQGRGSC